MSGAEQTDAVQCQQRVAALEAELAQIQMHYEVQRLHLETLQQENERLTAQCNCFHQSESRYRQIFENAPISMLLINTDGYISQMNAAAEELFGLTIDQLNQQACPVFDNPQLVENGTLPYMLRAFAGEAVVELPTYYDASRNFPGGKLNQGRGHYAPIRDAMGNIKEIVEVSADFTEFFALQEQLLQEKERAAQNRAQLLSTIAQVANLLLRSSDYTTVLPDVVRLLGEAVGSDRCTVGQDEIVGGATLSVKAIAEWCRAGISRVLDIHPDFEGGVEPFAEIYRPLAQGQSVNVLVDDLAEPVRSFMDQQGITSLLLVPILVQGQSWGHFAFDNCGEARLFDEGEIAVLRIAADSIAAAIERQTKDDELRQSQQALLQAEQNRATELASANAALQAEIIERQRAEQVSRGQTEALVRTLNTLSQEPVFDNCLGFMLQAIADQLSDRSGGIYLYSEDYDTTLLHLNYENGQIQRGKDIQHPCAHAPEPLRQWDDEYMPLLKQRQILIQDVGHYPHNIERGIKQILVVPLLFGDTFLGNITLRSTCHRQYHPEELELAQALAYQVTLAVQLTRMAEEVRQAAILEERNRMARDIHDTLAQSLTGVVMQLNAATEFLNSQPNQTQACIVRAQNLARQGLTEARRSVWLLYDSNLNALGLSDSLTRLIEQMTSRTTRIVLTIEGTPCCLDAPVNMALLRIAQESLTNALRHAKPQTINLQLIYTPQQVQLQVRDDGCGFDPEQTTGKGLGIVGMRDRARAINAQLQIESKLGIGTQTIVTVAIASS
ncbi:GAF domain-containing protein [Leptolyngbya ohadii]|uniref:GAF domain-containing protein n=1 Tax=Leptolyngbya ohadii TaxID=1962290 RepID=UPI000B5989EE|nr:GAF domain-containing protein [Leptolyngbya ohadii]